MRKKGSITVFVALSMMLIVSFLLALFEGARICGIETYVDMTSELALESVCAEYQDGLWEKYHLLCLDGAYGAKDFSVARIEGTLKNSVEQNIKTQGLHGNLMAVHLCAVSVPQYQLLTDGDGAVFLQQIVADRKKEVPMHIAESLYERLTSGEAIEENTVEDSIEQAQSAIMEARESEENANSEGDVEAEDSTGTEDSAGTSVPMEVNENPLEIAMALKQNAILGMVIEDVGGISGKKVDLSQSLQKRKCQQGTVHSNQDIGWLERIVTFDYLDTYYSNYLSNQENHALAYETEYVLGGKASDKENLEYVVRKLMWLREAANVMHLVGDTQKKAEAEAIAVVLAGFTGSPEIIKVVQIGIIAAWAYIESIQDVRALLQNDKIALIKTKDQWTTDTENLLSSILTFSKAKNCEGGFSYADYMKIFLFTLSQKDLAYGMMDVMEQNIRLMAGQSECRMDHMISKLYCSMEYEADTVILPAYEIARTVEKSFSYEL